MRIGDVAVHSVFDGVIPLPPDLLYPDVPVSVWQAVPGALDGEGMLPIPFGGFLADDHQGHRVLFDLGGGVSPELVPGGAPPEVRELLPARLEELGCPLGSVTDVVLTHLHIDHVGWASTDGRATFPDARHHIHAADWKHFVDGDADELVRRKVAPLGEAAILWDGAESAPIDWLRLIHTPGHTPGSAIALIESGGESLALVGDLFHHPEAAARPHWRCGFDWDAQAATAARSLWAEQLRATGTPLAGPHFPGLEPITLR